MDKVFIFDWDGTLVDTIELLKSAYNSVFENFGMPLWSFEEARQNIRKAAKFYFRDNFGEHAEKAMQIYYSYVEDNHLDHVRAYPGTELILKNLHDKDVKMGVVSNKRHDFLVSEIRHMGWDDMFSGVVGAGYAGNDKPFPDPLLMCIELMDVESTRENIYFIGDTKTDIECASRADIKSIFVTYGMGTKNENITYIPHKTIDTLKEIMYL